MMKKVMFVVVSLLLVSYCFALESAPSNKVGYVKVSLAGGAGFAYTQIGLPFKFWDVPTGNVPTYGTESMKPSDIFGTQPLPGGSSAADRIVSSTGDVAWRNASGVWTGGLEALAAGMEPGRMYFVRTNNQPQKNYVLAGEADTTAIGIPARTLTPGTVGSPFYLAYSWRDPRELQVDRLNLVAQGFLGGTSSTSDKILGVEGSAWLRASDGVWMPRTPDGTRPALTIVPGRAYYIINKHSTPWNYTYNASGASLTLPTKGEASSIMKVAPASKTATKAVKSSTTSAK